MLQVEFLPGLLRRRRCRCRRRCRRRHRRSCSCSRRPRLLAAAVLVVGEGLEAAVPLLLLLLLGHGRLQLILEVGAPEGLLLLLPALAVGRGGHLEVQLTPEELGGGGGVGGAGAVAVAPVARSLLQDLRGRKNENGSSASGTTVVCIYY